MEWLLATTKLRCWLALAAGLLVLLATSLATADDDVARKQFRKAQELYDAGEFAVALPLFETALETSDSPNARLYVARCQRELGSLVTAYNQMTLTLLEAEKLAESEDKYVPTRDAARNEQATLAEQVARVTVVLSGDVPDDVSVQINGVARDTTSLATPFAVTSGEVVVEASSESSEPARATANVELGAISNISVTIRAKKALEPTPAPKRPAAPSDEGLSGVQIAGIAVGIVGVGGFVMMGVTGAMANSKLDQLDSDCGGQRCTDPAAADTVDEGEMLALLSNVGLGIGIAGVLAGGAMLVFGGDLLAGDDESASLWVAPGAGALHLGGRF